MIDTDLLTVLAALTFVCVGASVRIDNVIRAAPPPITEEEIHDQLAYLAYERHGDPYRTKGPNE